MVGGGLPSSESKVEFGDLNNSLAICQTISTFPESGNEGGVGTFLGDRGFFCGGYNVGYSTDKCYSWDSVV